MLDAVFKFFGDIVASPIKDWSTRKTLEAQTKAQVDILKAQAMIERAKRGAEVEANWDVEALRQSQFSWKDEWFAVLLSLPFLGSFIPVVQDYVAKGWEYVAKAPNFYQGCFIGAICASFGIRWMFSKNKP